MTPQALYALHLLYRLASIHEKNRDKVEWLSRILNFFKTKTLLLADEFHRNGDPLTRAIFGTGQFHFIPQNQRDLLMSLMYPLLGIQEVYTDDKEKRAVSTLSRMKSNLLGMPSSEDIDAIRKALALHLVTSPLLDIPVANQEEFVRYWSEKKQTPPQLMEMWSKGNSVEKERAGLLALANYFFEDMLENIPKMRTGLDHGVSIYPEEKFDTPCHHKSPTTAQFEDAFIAIVLTIKGYYHRGLSKADTREMLSKLVNQYYSAQSFNSANLQATSQQFTRWMATAPHSIKTLNLADVDLNDVLLMDQLIAFLSKNQLTIDDYLQSEVLPQIGIAKEQFIVTPRHIMVGRRLYFTATH